MLANAAPGDLVFASGYATVKRYPGSGAIRGDFKLARGILVAIDPTHPYVDEMVMMSAIVLTFRGNLVRIHDVRITGVAE